MSTKNTESTDTETETESADNNTDFSVEALRHRLTGTLTGKQERVGVCLLRNPDAPLTAIGNKTGVSSTTVLNALKSLVNEHGLDEDGKAEAWSKRGGVRRAKTYTELTPKQKAVIDWAARHEGTREDLFDPEANLTSEKVATAIEHDERYDVALHSTYPNKVLQDPPEAGDESRASYGHLVDERREVLAARGELDEETEAEAVESLRVKPPRALLEAADWDLPESNLDSLDEAESMTRQERLDKAFENAESKDEEEPVTEEDRREHSAPLTCPECRHEAKADECPKCGHDKRYEWAKEDETEETTEDEDEDEDLSEEISEPLVQDAEALEDALEGLTERLNDLGDSVDTLRESAVHESELEEVLGNFEERLQSALDEHKEEVNAEVDERLHNSVRAQLMERVDTLESDLGKLGATVDSLKDAEAATPEEPRLMADGHLDDNTRLSLVVNELVELAEAGAAVTGMEVKNRRHGKAREYVITVDEEPGRGPRMAGEEDAEGGEE